MFAAPDYLWGRVVERRPLSDKEADESRFVVSFPFSQMGPVCNQEHLPEAIRSISLHFVGTGRNDLRHDLDEISLTIVPRSVRSANRLMGKIITIIITDSD